MTVKLFEVRDKGTFIPMFAFRPRPNGPPDIYTRERWLLGRAGFGNTGPLVIFGRLEASGVSNNCTYDPYSWGNRTMQVAHRHVEQYFDDLPSGSVIDVQFILGETTKPKRSEQDD